MTLSPGQILQERYRIDALIGQGGFGAVYKAWDLVQNRVCACKENLETSEAAVDQFGREAVILASLEHPNLPCVTDHFVLPGQGQYLVMDFVEGRSLAARMAEQGGALPESEALPWIEQVCEAVAYLHSLIRPIIHRDIKPQNIIITPAGRAMLVDFGISKVARPGAFTQAGGRAITEGFSPPEQYGLAGRTDARSDIYSLGATLYAALTGKSPPDAVDRMQGSATLVPPRQIRPEISRTTEAAILKAMQPQVAERFQTVEELQHALRGHPSEPAPLPATRAVGGVLPITRRAGTRAAIPHASRLYLALGGIALVAIAALVVVLARAGKEVAPASGDLRTAATVASGVLSPNMTAARGETPGGSAPRGSEPAGSAVPDVGGPSPITGLTPAARAASATPIAAALPTEASGQPARAAQLTAGPAPTTQPPNPPSLAPRATSTRRTTPVPTDFTPTPSPDVAGILSVEMRLTPLPELSALGPALLHELFSSDLSGWPVEDGDSDFQDWEVSLNRGRYRIADLALDDDVTIYASAPEFALQDFLLVTDATLIGASGTAVQRLYFRCQDPSADSCYVADFASNGEYALRRTKGGEYTVVGTPGASKAIRTRPGDTNTFAVLASGSTFTLYANGQPLRAITDRTYPNAGYFLLGVGVPNTGDDAVVEFDNLFVTQLAGQTPPVKLPGGVTPVHVRLFERFDDNARDWNVGRQNDQLADTEYQISDGVLRASMAAKEGVITSRAIPDLQLANFSLSVDATFTSYTGDGDILIFFRCEDGTMDYCHLARFYTDGSYSIGRWQGDKYTTLVDWTKRSEIKTGAGAINNFGVVARGPLVEVYANDVLLHSLTVSEPTAAGELRLGAGTFEAGVQLAIEFDNLLIVEDYSVR